MEALIQTLQGYIGSIDQYWYPILFVGLFIEGFSALLIGGFLISIGAIALVPGVLILAAGEILAGYMWYGVGAWGGAASLQWFVSKRPGRERLLVRVRKAFEQYGGAVIFLAKVTFSITIVTQILAGSLKYPFKKFSLYNIVGSIIWVGIVAGFGFFFGASYQAFVDYWDSVSNMIMVALVTIALIMLFRMLFRTVITEYLDVAEGIERLHALSHSVVRRFFVSKK